RCGRFLTEQAERLADAEKLTPVEGGPASRVPPSADPRQRAREGLVHALFNHTEFVTIRCGVAMHRRTFLADAGLGFTGLTLASMLHRDGFAARGDEPRGSLGEPRGSSPRPGH